MLYQLVVLCCLCALWRLWSKKPCDPEPPQLSGKLPIVGNAFRLLGNGVKMYKSLRSIAEECLQKGGLIIMNMGPRKVYGVADPEDSLLISNQCLQKSFVYDFTKPYFGDGLITVDATKWKTNRKLLNPAFNQQVLDGFVGVFNSQARSLVEHFAVQIGKPFDHNYLLRLNNLETICTTALGVDSSKYSELQKQYLPRIETLLRVVNERMQKFWLHSDFIYNMTQQKKMADEELNHVLALSKSIIKDKRAEKRNKKSNAGKFKPFVDLILELADDKGCFTDEYIRGEIDTIIGAGHDTIASLLSFVLPVLGSHADVQEKAYNEILDVIGTKKNNIEVEHLSKLVYIEAVLRETLRLYSVVPIQGRRIDKDVKLKNYTVKKNTDCFLFIDGLHRHSIWGADAEEFRPERWLDKETLPDTKYFGGFGVGRRSCIGKTYAMMSMKITLAHVLQNYSISSDMSKMLVTIQMVTKPVSGHFITLAHRNTV